MMVGIAMSAENMTLGEMPLFVVVQKDHLLSIYFQEPQPKAAYPSSSVSGWF